MGSDELSEASSGAEPAAGPPPISPPPAASPDDAPTLPGDVPLLPGDAPLTQPLPAAGQAAPARGRGVRAGRNLPAAIAVGLLLGGVAILTLFTVKFTFLIYMGAMVGMALLELSRALGGRGIRFPVVPVAVGGAGMLVLAYLRGERPLVAVLALTTIAVLSWRLAGGSTGYLRDVTAGSFALVYLALPASFVGLMLAPADGARRTLTFLILAVCSDVGGYLAGILTGRHLMVPAISPKKTWEGFGGAALACLAGGAITMTTLLHGAAWQGVLVGAGAFLAATVGDLVESMIKRDLQIKDMGSILPGHGGILDRLDSLLITAPVVWLLLVIFLH